MPERAPNLAPAGAKVGSLGVNRPSHIDRPGARLEMACAHISRQIAERGHGAFESVGEHDDLERAVALACCWTTSSKPLAA